VIYFFSVQDTPGKVYERSASSKGLVTSQKDFWFMLLMNIPLIEFGFLGA